MARAADAIPDNASGDFFVDSTCIDCDLCRQIAPGVFAYSERARQSYVAAQPGDTHRSTLRALMALVACPTSSIGTRTKHDTHAAARAFPEPIDGDIYFCGYASERSYGAASYLIVRPAGNVLVDSPRFATTLAERIAELGGISRMLLTHEDDVADHAKWHARFGCERVAHRADAPRGIEHVVDGDTELADDLRVIHVPGHTRGSIALLHGDALFTGDHLWATDDGDGVEAGRDVCWYDWDEQLRSIEKLAAYSFTRIFPGHGRRFVAASAEDMRTALRRAID